MMSGSIPIALIFHDNTSLAGRTQHITWLNSAVLRTCHHSTQVERLSHELFPMATRCAKDAVLCGINYTAAGRLLANSTNISELKEYFYR